MIRRISDDERNYDKAFYNSHTLNEIVDALPVRPCFFDTRHGWVATLDEPLPFSLTTKIVSNSQQFVRVYAED